MLGSGALIDFHDDEEPENNSSTPVKIGPMLAGALERIASSKVNPVVVITDYAPGDQAQAKVLMALAANVPNMQYVEHVYIPPLRTDILAFRLLMLALVKKDYIPIGTIFYCNVAPIYGPGEKNGHHPLRLLVLKNGHIVIIPDAGDSLEYFGSSNFVSESYNIATDQNDIQFRSATIFPEALGKIFSRDYSDLTPRTLIDDDTVFAYGDVWDQDNYGNVRLFYPVSVIQSFGTKNSRITIIRDGIPVAFGVTKSYVKKSSRDLDVRGGSNIIYTDNSSEIFEQFVDIFKVGGMANRQLVLDIKGYGFFDALREVIKVSYAAFRTAGFFMAFIAFCSVSWKRFWISGTPEHTRTPPKITLRLIDFN